MSYDQSKIAILLLQILTVCRYFEIIFHVWPIGLLWNTRPKKVKVKYEDPNWALHAKQFLLLEIWAPSNHANFMYTTNNNFLNIFQLICSYWLGTCYPNNSFVASKTTKISWFTNFLLNNSFIVLKTFNWEKFCWLTNKNFIFSDKT